ncbi:hypothetical protein SAMN05443144_10239 [Fodinibius roseus]|uniref:Uncharacterized protein n=1 Tax=Fodinibius roseus TaxID=1194090 RepID=A0A1M4UHT3_9BACT|nr:hypothetical protein SAMN05443144_10239 [Fodinibius roseus]
MYKTKTLVNTAPKALPRRGLSVALTPRTRRLEFVNGNWEVVEWQAGASCTIRPTRALSRCRCLRRCRSRFTIEFEAHFKHGNQQRAVATVEPEGRGGARTYAEGRGQPRRHLSETRAATGCDASWMPRA